MIVFSLRLERFSIDTYPPNGIGPKCSASGPSAATGRNSRAPIITIVPSKRKPKVGVSSRMVPSPNGDAVLAPMPAARAIGAMIGMNRLIAMTMVVAMSHARLVGAGLGLLLKPQVSPRPSKPEPLFADAEENSYMVSENP